MDQSGASVSLTTWGEKAVNFEKEVGPDENPIVAIKGAKISDFSGRSLSTLASSNFQVIYSLLGLNKRK